MSIHVTCAGCRRRYNVRDEHAGKRGRCPFCTSVVAVPRTAIRAQPPVWPATRHLPGDAAVAPSPGTAAPTNSRPIWDTRSTDVARRNDPDQDAPVRRLDVPRWAWVAMASVLALFVVGGMVLFKGGDRPGPAAETRASTPPPAPSARQQADRAFQEVEALEKDAGEEYEKVSDAYRRFLAQHLTPTVWQQAQARRKIDVELPAKIDDRDFGGMSRTATEASDDPAAARSRCQEYLTRHPNGRHVPEAQRALERLFPWKMRLVKATLAGEYREGVGQPDFTFRSTAVNGRVALVEVRFQATSASPGTLQERLRPGRAVLSADAMDFLDDKGKIVDQFRAVLPDQSERLARPARLFLSNQVELVLPDRTRLQPGITSAPSPCNYGCSAIEGKLSVHIGTPREEVGVFRYARGGHITAALVQPGKPVTLTLVYTVPAETENATLRFYDCPPIEVVFPRPEKPLGPPQVPDHPRADPDGAPGTSPFRDAC